MSISSVHASNSSDFVNFALVSGTKSTWSEGKFASLVIEEASNSNSTGNLLASLRSHEHLMSESHDGSRVELVMNESSGPSYTPYSERPETYIVPIVFLSIYISGIIGNCTLIYVMLKEKLLRTPSYMFILNLAFGDLLVIICTVPFVGTIYTFESWPFGLFVCKASEFMRDVSNSVTVLTLCAMSIDRYRAAFSTTLRSNVRTYYTAGTSGRRSGLGSILCNLLGCTSLCNLSSFGLFKSIFKFVRSPTGMVMTAIWAISLVAAFPTAYTSFILEYPLEPVGGPYIIKVCYPYPPDLGENYPKVVVASKCIFLYIIPTIIIGYCYVSIAIHLMYKAKTSLASTHYASSLPTTTTMTTSVTTTTTPTTTTTTTTAMSKTATTRTTSLIKSPSEVTTSQVPFILNCDEKETCMKQDTCMDTIGAIVSSTGSIQPVKNTPLADGRKNSTNGDKFADCNGVGDAAITTIPLSNGTFCPSSSCLSLFASRPSSCSSLRHSSPSSSICCGGRGANKLSRCNECTCSCQSQNLELPCDADVNSTLNASETCHFERKFRETRETHQCCDVSSENNLGNFGGENNKNCSTGCTLDQVMDGQEARVTIAGDNCCSKCHLDKEDHRDDQKDQLDEANISGMKLLVASPSGDNSSRSKLSCLSRSFTMNTMTDLYEGQGDVQEGNGNTENENSHGNSFKGRVSLEEDKLKCDWTFDRMSGKCKSSRSNGSNGRGRFIPSLAKNKSVYSEMKLVEPRYSDQWCDSKYLEKTTSLKCIKSRLLQLSGRPLVASITGGMGNKGSEGGSFNSYGDGRSGQGPEVSHVAHSVLIKSRKKSQSRAKMILLLVVIFLICFFPNHLFMMWFYFNPESPAHYNNFWHVWRIVAFCLAFLNSTLNPITLYLTSDQFKHLFNKYLLKCFTSENVQETTSNSGDSFNVITNK